MGSRPRAARENPLACPNRFALAIPRAEICRHERSGHRHRLGHDAALRRIDRRRDKKQLGRRSRGRLCQRRRHADLARRAFRRCVRSDELVWARHNSRPAAIAQAASPCENGLCLSRSPSRYLTYFDEPPPPPPPPPLIEPAPPPAPAPPPPPPAGLVA